MFDSGASISMSGDPSRLVGGVVPVKGGRVTGFDGGGQGVVAMGCNEDAEKELVVSGMASGLVLLSAHQYTAGGATVLHPDSGTVYRLSEEERMRLREFLVQFQPVMQLTVRNGVYEVCEEVEAFVANTFFNSKVNVSSAEEMILAYMLSGLSFDALMDAARSGTFHGVHKCVTVAALNSFQRKFGRTPDVVQLAHPNVTGPGKGYLSIPEKVKERGEVVQIDALYSDFYETVGRGKAEKLRALGGASCAYLAVDKYTGHCCEGGLVAPGMLGVDIVKAVVDACRTGGVSVRAVATDVGLTSLGVYQVSKGATQKFLEERGIRSIVAPPYEHNVGTEVVERSIQTVKNRMRMAYAYVMDRMDMVRRLGWTEGDLRRLWGEIFMWAWQMEGFAACRSDESVSRYEAFWGKRLSAVDLRVLPIFSVVKTWRPAGAAGTMPSTNQGMYVRGLYVGPDRHAPGVIRVALMVIRSDGRKAISLIRTIRYKGVSDGGDIGIEEHVDKGLARIVEAQEEDLVGDGPVRGSPTAQIEPGGMESSVAVQGDVAGGAETPGLLDSGLIREGGAVEAPTMGVPGGADLTAQAKGACDRPEESMMRKGRKRSRRKKGESVVADEPQVPEDMAVKETVPDTGEVKRRRVDKKVVRRSSRGRVINRLFQALLVCSTIMAQVELSEKREGCQGGDVSSAMQNAFFVDWSSHESGDYYYDAGASVFFQIAETAPLEIAEAYRAVTEGVPRTFQEALRDRIWGQPAQAEVSGLVAAGTIVQCRRELAQEAIAAGADFVIVFPVYEEKVKAGEVVRKVRLVCNGKTQIGAGETYSPTPSREELLLLLHLAAFYDWEITHLDETRAFLSAKYSGETPVYAKIAGDKRFWKVLGALYGLKTSPKDYGDEVSRRLVDVLGFTRLHTSSCIYYKRGGDGEYTFVYDYVDDFLVFGRRGGVDEFVKGYRGLATTSEPVPDPGSFLGMEMVRDRERRLLSVTMKGKILESVERMGVGEVEKPQLVPMSQAAYLVRDYEFDELKDQSMAEFLDEEGVRDYMTVVGILLWVSGVRRDILFAVLYLTWSTKSPRKHHAAVALGVIRYLQSTIDVPLVLGGTAAVRQHVYADASYGTAPQGRSVGGWYMSLGPNAGAVFAKAKASMYTRLSSFEAELEFCCLALRSLVRFSQLMGELGIEAGLPCVYGDNRAMVDFVSGSGVAKSVRHMEIRMWYAREMFKRGGFEMQFMRGEKMPADGLTKVRTQSMHEEFMRDIQGLRLLDGEDVRA